MEKLSFDDVLEKLEYLSAGDTRTMSADDVAENIREQIRSWGWECLDEYENAEDWLEDHPEVDEEGCGDNAVETIEFPCESAGGYECYYEFVISFYGIWGEEGVFIVEF